MLHELVESALITLSFASDTAIGIVLDPSGEIETLRLAHRERASEQQLAKFVHHWVRFDLVPEVNALHNAFDLE
jgi:hypothetical protein